MTATTPPVLDQPVSTESATASTAASLLIALRAVVKGFERVPLDKPPHTHEGRPDAQPAPRKIAALMEVASHERMSISALAAKLGISLATASQVVTDLESAQLVERVEDPTDRRRTLVQVSEARRATTDAILNSRLRPVQRALDRMRPAEQRAVLRGLELIAEELGNTNV